MVQIELGRLGFQMGLNGPILSLYALKMQQAAPPAVSVQNVDYNSMRTKVQAKLVLFW